MVSSSPQLSYYTIMGSNSYRFGLQRALRDPIVIFCLFEHQPPLGDPALVIGVTTGIC